LGRTSTLLHTGSFCDTSDLGGKKGSVNVSYRPKTREKGVDLYMTGICKKGHGLRFNYMYFLASNTSQSKLKVDVPGIVGPVSISSDQNMAATGEIESSGNSTIKLWKMIRSDFKQSLTFRGVVSAMALSSDGSVIAAAITTAEKTAIRLWDTTTGQVKWEELSPPVGTLAFSQDGSLIASGGFENDGTIYIRDAASGSIKLNLHSDTDGGVTCLAFRNTRGLMLSAGFSSGVIKLWDITDGSLIQTLNNEGPAGALAFSGDGRVLASGDAKKGTIKIWAITKPPNP